MNRVHNSDCTSGGPGRTILSKVKLTNCVCDSAELEDM